MLNIVEYGYLASDHYKSKTWSSKVPSATSKLRLGFRRAISAFIVIRAPANLGFGLIHPAFVGLLHLVYPCALSIPRR